MQRLVPRNRVSTGISPQQIIQYEMLRLPSHRLGAHLLELSYANPLLEVIEHEPCARCGQPLRRRRALCAGCERLALGPVPTGGSVDDEQRSWIEQASVAATLSQSLWQQVRESDFDPNERRILFHLIDDLDEQGYLSTETAQHARDLGCPSEEIERLRRELMALEPLGVGARDARECLIVQARALEGRFGWARIARRLYEQEWEALMEGTLRRAARALGVSVAQLESAFRQGNEHFYLYPAYGRLGADTETIYIQPDVRFVPSDDIVTPVRVEVLESHRYRIGLASAYRDLLEVGGADARTAATLGRWQSELRHLRRALRQRWSTLARVCEMLVEFQREFFVRGAPYSIQRLQPLTREEIAAALDVHPSTVGRAVSGKYAELPDRRVVPLSLFFDSTAPVRALIKEMIDAEEERPLSDGQIAERLRSSGWSLTRRMVGMHRESLGILPAHLRRRARKLHGPVSRRERLPVPG